VNRVDVTEWLRLQQGLRRYSGHAAGHQTILLHSCHGHGSLLLLYTFSLTFLLSKVSVAMSFAIGIVLALLIIVLALISRYRQEPPRRRALGLISIMILYQAIMVVGWIVLSDR
jgi:hypothetical protein